MRASVILSALLATISLVAQGPAATVIDWWSMTGGELFDDANTVVGTYSLTATEGELSSAHPLAHPYNGSYWNSPSEFIDSSLADSTLPSYDFLAVPSASGFSYTLTISSTHLNNAHLAIGNLSPLTDTTIRILPIDATASPLPTPLLFLQERSWDAGFSPYDTPLNWNAVTNTLTVSSGTSNDSGLAWFQLPNTGMTALTLEISGSNAIPIGDSLSFAIGAIPEPSSALLAGLGCFLGIFRRKRKTSLS
ncbi:PEP-CTERM sorting domain-containing protein [Roseibacillus persicicus]|uniref:PEP-CTERM sorting domain-containing protein n=1 Tax=Roseibacillus persicicus TaxID=454148 RepID=UPI00398B8FFB